MSKRYRYLLLLFGFIIFLIVAPMLVMYAGGWVYDRENKEFMRTGLLAIKSEPREAQVFLDGKLKRDSSGDIKFLEPKEYDLILKKEGYREWGKRFRVSAGQVTWATPPFGKIYLFKRDNAAKVVAGGVLDYALAGGRIFYITSATLTVGPADKLSNNDNFSLPGEAASILVSPNARYAALLGNNNFFLFDYNTKKFTDLTGQINSSAQVKFSPQNELYALEGQTLYRFSLGQKQSVLKNVAAFGFEGDDLYYIKSGPTNQLWIANTPSSEGQMLISDLPSFKNGEMLITVNRQILILAENTLYSVNSGLQKIHDGLTDWDFDLSQQSFIFSRGGELYTYNFSADAGEFITRSQETIASPRVSLLTSYAFYLSPTDFSAIELDPRDRQNQYQLYSGTRLSSLTIDKSASAAWLLDNGKLVSLTLR